MSRAPTPELRRATQRHVRAVTESVHSGLIDWLRLALADAGLDDLDVLDSFPASASRPAMVAFPFRMGPERMVDHNDAGRSLMSKVSQPAEEALVPKPWRDIGQMVNETLQSVLPQELRGGRTVPSRRPAVDDMPPLLKAWFNSMPAEEGWVVDAPDGRRAMVPALWWHPTYPIELQYLLCGVTPEGVDTPVGGLLPALVAVRTAVHLSGVLDLTLPPVPAPEHLWSFLYALVNSIDDDNLDAPEPEDFEEAIEAARMEFGTQLGVVPTQHIPDRAIFSLMQAIGRPLHATLCLRVRVGVAHRVGFAPGSDFAPNVGRR